MFSQAQKIVLETYGGGDYAWMLEDGQLSGPEDIEVALNHSGDTLFVFLMRELAENEDCDSMAEAQRRVSVARDQLQEVLDALDADD